MFAVIHVPRQASMFLQRVPRVVGSGETRGRPLLVSTSSTEDDSSIVSLQARFSDLLLLRWFRRLLFWVVRVIRLPAALSLTADLRGASWAPMAFPHNSFC